MDMTKKNDPSGELDDTTQSTVTTNSNTVDNSSNTNDQTTDEIKKVNTNVEKKVYHF